MSITPLLENLFEDAVVTAMVNYTVDEALFLSQDRITRHVQKLSQEKLDDIESGIRSGIRNVARRKIRLNMIILNM